MISVVAVIDDRNQMIGTQFVYHGMRGPGTMKIVVFLFAHSSGLPDGPRVQDTGDPDEGEEDDDEEDPYDEI